MIIRSYSNLTHRHAPPFCWSSAAIQITHVMSPCTRDRFCVQWSGKSRCLSGNRVSDRSQANKTGLEQRSWGRNTSYVFRKWPGARKEMVAEIWVIEKEKKRRRREPPTQSLTDQSSCFRLDSKNHPRAGFKIKTWCPILCLEADYGCPARATGETRGDESGWDRADSSGVNDRPCLRGTH